MFKGESQVAMQGTSFSAVSPLKSTWDIHPRRRRVLVQPTHSHSVDGQDLIGQVADWTVFLTGRPPLKEAEHRSKLRNRRLHWAMSLEQMIQGKSVQWPTFNLEASMSLKTNGSRPWAFQLP